MHPISGWFLTPNVPGIDGSSRSAWIQMDDQYREDTKGLPGFQTSRCWRNGMLTEVVWWTQSSMSLRLTLPMPDCFVIISTYATSFAPPDCWSLRYQIFRRYVVQVLNGIDPDPAAQEMMLEQFVAEVPIRGICDELEGLSGQLVGFSSRVRGI